jgi:hypothetical protein
VIPGVSRLVFRAGERLAHGKLNELAAWATRRVTAGPGLVVEDSPSGVVVSLEAAQAPAWHWAELTGATLDGDNRWRYAHRQMVWDHTHDSTDADPPEPGGYHGWRPLTGGIAAAAADDDCARNLANRADDDAFAAQLDLTDDIFADNTLGPLPLTTSTTRIIVPLRRVASTGDPAVYGYWFGPVLSPIGGSCGGA